MGVGGSVTAYWMEFLESKERRDDSRHSAVVGERVLVQLFTR